MIMQRMVRWIGVSAPLALALLFSVSLDAAAPESRRMSRAKDLIADEQWVLAIDELRAAADDPKERAKDEALFWLAHSHNQAGDRAAAVETIRRLEQQFPTSRWTKPARSLRIEIAQRLQRKDVLWFTAAPPPAPAVGPAPPTPVAPPQPRQPGPVAPPPTPRPPAAVPPHAPAVAPAPAPPPEPWFGAEFHYEKFHDVDLRIQALGSLIKTDALKVIPILKQIAMESGTPGEARRALFVLAQSGRPEARATVVEVAKTAPDAVRIAAIRELGRFGGAEVGRELLQVYSTANDPVKYQVMMSLGERAETVALLRIAESEADRALRERAILTLGRAGGRDELRRMYSKAPRPIKRAIINGLFNARAETELRQIVEEEKDDALRNEAQARLLLLATTPPAKRRPKTP